MSTIDPTNPFMNPLGPGPDPADVDPPIPDDLVDAFFDRELDDATRAAFTRRLDEDASCCERVAKTHRMLSMLRRGVKPPDLSASILDRVDSVRGFVPRKHRRLIRAGRAAVVLALLGVVASAVVVRHRAPEVVAFGSLPSPVRDVASAACEDAAGLERFARSVRGERFDAGSLRLASRVDVSASDATRAGEVRVVGRSLDRSPCALGEVVWEHEGEAPVSVRVLAQSAGIGGVGDELVLMVGGRIVRLPLEAIGLELSDGVGASRSYRFGSSVSIGVASDGRSSGASLVPVTFTRRALSTGARASTITDLP